jgi:hypothetical protein
MKNVAAMSGQSVNFAILFLGMGAAGKGACLGNDAVLNFFSFVLLKRPSLWTD